MASDSSNTQTHTSDQGTKTKAGACSNCRSRKIRCTFSATASACQSCVAKGQAQTCVPQETKTRQTRALSTPPPDRQEVVNSQPARRGRRNTQSGPQPTVKQPQKRQGSVPPNAETKAKRQRKSAAPGPSVSVQQDVPSAHHLDSISEVDESEDVAPPSFNDPAADPSFEQIDQSIEMNSFISVLSGNHVEYNVDGDYNNVNGDGSHSRYSPEDFNMDVSGSDSESDNGSHEVLKQRRKMAPAIKKGQRASASQPSQLYDPETCDFTIECTAPRPDGSNAPFKISSDITLDALRNVVAEKIERFPAHVRLQYRLDSDKAKTNATSIQNDEELDIFIGRIRALVVPTRLANGKPSTRAIKAVTVRFEDAGTKDISTTSSAGNGKKAINNTRTSAATKEKSPAVSPSGRIEGSTQHQEYVKSLQERWTCKSHSKSPDSPTYCYCPGGSKVCWPLTHGNISYWALEMMEPGTAVTVDNKPAGLTFVNARPRTRPPHAPSISAAETPAATPGGYAYPPPPVIVLPPTWGGPGYHGSEGLSYPSNQRPSSTYLTPPSHHPAPHSGSPSVADIPDIVRWFAYLDEHEERNKDGIVFAPYGPILRQKGFLRISQLTRNYVQLSDLQTWLGIEVGIAILIMQYAEFDLAAVNAGKRILSGPF
ncbi:hypothetical protein BV22DRAFT_1130419 [Leucogyrophana mollusca]|uniref:Uncharacterized protein n=1 Tax=Leucogyrophana mollusca TaxID=85980 RepID=A0ACB8BGQ6_9AGAM|nr:hypothetical protein BV22DRAFT_1130419 [Leucogyrophana mollusca]